MLVDTVSTHLVKGSDLNHHGTLFAGRMAEWFVEACFLAGTRFLGNPENLVCVKIHGLAFTKPAMPGDVIEIVAAVAKAGTKSITVGAEVFINDEPLPSVRGFATFVSVDSEGDSYPHGLCLTPEWVAAHKSLCDEADGLPRR